jgi:hypothetical protein
MDLDSNMAPYRPGPPTIMCERCRYVRIYFDQKQRNKNSVLIPLEWRTGLKHDCLQSIPKYCPCGILIYFDDKVLSATGKKIPLQYSDDCYHFCKEEPSR